MYMGVRVGKGSCTVDLVSTPLQLCCWGFPLLPCDHRHCHVVLLRRCHLVTHEVLLKRCHFVTHVVLLKRCHFVTHVVLLKRCHFVTQVVLCQKLHACLSPSFTELQGVWLLSTPAHAQLSRLPATCGLPVTSRLSLSEAGLA